MDIDQIKQAFRIQTSFLNSGERKVLIWLAERQPKWMFSDLLSFVGFLGAIITSFGYALSGDSPIYLWIASLGLVINWYGDSLDGTLARVRDVQRPVYGFYIDHTLDVICELIIFIGLGISELMDMRIALLIQITYLMMTVNVTINTHLKSEFRLTYAKLGPTEFRLLAIILNTILAISPTLRNFKIALFVFGRQETLMLLDIMGIAVLFMITTMYFVTVVKDAKEYAKADPIKCRKDIKRS